MAIITRADGTKVNVGESPGEFQSRMQSQRIAERGLTSQEKHQLGSQASAVEAQSKEIAKLPVSEQKVIFESGKYYRTPSGEISAREPKQLSNAEYFRQQPLRPEVYEAVKRQDMPKSQIPFKDVSENITQKVFRQLRGYETERKLGQERVKELITKLTPPKQTSKGPIGTYVDTLKGAYKNIDELERKGLTKSGKLYTASEKKVSEGLKLNELQSFFERKVSERREEVIKKLESLGQLKSAEELKKQRGQLTAGLEQTKDITSHPIKTVGEIALTSGIIKGLTLLPVGKAKIAEKVLGIAYIGSKSLEGLREYKETGDIRKTEAGLIKDLAILGISSGLVSKFGKVEKDIDVKYFDEMGSEIDKNLFKKPPVLAKKEISMSNLKSFNSKIDSSKLSPFSKLSGLGKKGGFGKLGEDNRFGGLNDLVGPKKKPNLYYFEDEKIGPYRLGIKEVKVESQAQKQALELLQKEVTIEQLKKVQIMRQKQLQKVLLNLRLGQRQSSLQYLNQLSLQKQAQKSFSIQKQGLSLNQIQRLNQLSLQKVSQVQKSASLLSLNQLSLQKQAQKQELVSLQRLQQKQKMEKIIPFQLLKIQNMFKRKKKRKGKTTPQLTRFTPTLIGSGRQSLKNLYYIGGEAR